MPTAKQVPSRGRGRHASPADPEDSFVEDYEDSTRAMRPSDHGDTVYSPEDIEEAIDLIIVRLRRRKVPFRIIGKILRRSKACVLVRYHRLPAQQRRFYEQAGLWGML